MAFSFTYILSFSPVDTDVRSKLTSNLGYSDSNKGNKIVLNINKNL